jgi:hypothetical protein
VYEVRDATDFHPSGSKPWVEELPPAGADSWASRSSRRKQRERYRLAFVPSKFRIGPEPEAFIVEINLTTEPWTVADVTNLVDLEGAAVRAQRAQEKAEKMSRARDALAAEVARRVHAGETPMLTERHAVPFLMALKLTRKLAREVVSNPEGRWELRKLDGLKGHPVALYPPRKNENDGGNTTTTEGASTADENAVDFRQPHEQQAAEIDPSQTRENSGPDGTPISAVEEVFPPAEEPAEIEAEAERPPASDTDGSDGEVKNAGEPQVAFVPVEDAEARPLLGRMNARGELVLTADDMPALRTQLESRGWQVRLQRGSVLECRPGSAKARKPPQPTIEKKLEEFALWGRALADPLVKRLVKNFDAEVVSVENLQQD